MNLVTCYRKTTDGLDRYAANPTRYIDNWTSDDAVLNRVRRVMNAVDGWEPICKTRERSLNVGDTIEIRRGLAPGEPDLVTTYIVAPLGFDRVPPAPAPQPLVGWDVLGEDGLTPLQRQMQNGADDRDDF